MTWRLSGKVECFLNLRSRRQSRSYLKVNRQRPTSVMRRPELKIPTLAKWIISPLVLVIINLCKKHFVLKTNSNINICNEI